MKRLLLLFTLALAVLPTPLPACAWDSDTLRDEAVQKGSLYDLITGQFPHHGDGYYAARIKRLKALPGLDFQSRNDLAVAYLRLENWKESEALLLENLKEKPGDYFTQSNLGVLEKKRGNYAASAEWIKKALAIKPEGHLGLGDWYLRNLEYRTQCAADPKKMPAQNFLGEDYSTGFVPMLSKEDLPDSKTVKDPGRLDRLRRMLENDQTFADGFLVTGDFLANTGDLNLAFLCYKRAVALKHPNPRELSRRLRAMYEHFLQVGYDGNSSREYAAYLQKMKKTHDAEAAKVFAAADTWLATFKKTEGVMAAKSGDEKATPESVEAEMERHGIKRPRA